MANAKTELTNETAMNILQSRQKNLITMDNVGTTLARPIKTLSDPMVDDNGNGYRIANFNMITPYNAKQINALLAEGDIQGACNQHLTFTVWENADFQPQAGKSVICEFGTFPTKDGETAICISAISPLASKEASSMSLDLSSLSADVQEEETLDEVLKKK